MRSIVRVDAAIYQICVCTDLDSKGERWGGVCGSRASEGDHLTGRWHCSHLTLCAISCVCVEGSDHWLHSPVTVYKEKFRPDEFSRKKTEKKPKTSVICEAAAADPV